MHFVPADEPISQARALHQRLLVRFREERGRVQIDATVTSRVTNLGHHNSWSAKNLGEPSSLSAMLQFCSDALLLYVRRPFGNR